MKKGPRRPLGAFTYRPASRQQAAARTRLRLPQSQLRGSLDGRRERADAERAVEVTLVGVDRVDRETELRAYLLGRESIGHESKDLHLPVGDRGGLADGRGFAGPFDHS